MALLRSCERRPQNCRARTGKSLREITQIPARNPHLPECCLPDKERCNQLLPKGKKKINPTFFSYTSFPLTSFPLFNSSSVFSVWPFFYCAELLHSAGSCYSASRQGSGRLKVSLEQSPSNVVHCARFSSAAINPLPLLPATPGGGSPPGHASPRPVALGARSSRVIFLIYCHSYSNRNILLFHLNQYRVCFSLFFFKDIRLHNCLTAKLFRSTSRGRAVGSFWL